MGFLKKIRARSKTGRGSDEGPAKTFLEEILGDKCDDTIASYNIWDQGDKDKFIECIAPIEADIFESGGAAVKMMHLDNMDGETC